MAGSTVIHNPNPDQKNNISQYDVTNHWPTPIICEISKPNWERSFPVKGQGVVIYTTHKHHPFAISIQAENVENWISLDIHDNCAVLYMRNGPFIRPLMMVAGDKSGLEKGGNVSYWYSYDRDRLVLKYGKGYRMEETTLMTYDFLKDVKQPEDKANIRKQLYSFFNAENQITARQFDKPIVTFKDNPLFSVYDAEAAESLYTKETVYSQVVYHRQVDPDVEFDRNPFVRNIPALVIDSSRVSLKTLDKGDFCLSAGLPLVCRELYENVKNCELDDSIKAETDRVKLSDAIRYSVEAEGCSLHRKLKKKADIFGCNPKTTYLRVTLGHSYGNSPGIPYVLEIWPSKHRSPIHNHGNAHAVIKVLFGSIRVQIFNKHTTTADAVPLKEFDARAGGVTWISRNWYQTHRLVNITEDFCATIQCYKYDDEENRHWPYFDYVSDDSAIKRFLPDSDFEFQEMCKIVLEEYLSSLQKVSTIKKALKQSNQTACEP